MESVEELVARFFDITSGAGERLAKTIEERDAEARQLPRAMLDEIWQEAEGSGDIDNILARYGYTVKEADE